MVWHLMLEGPKYLHYPKPSQSFLIVNQHYEEYAERIFTGSNIKIAIEVARHHGAVLDDISIKEQYLQSKMRSWKDKMLRNTFKDSRNSTTSCLFSYISKFKQKFTFFS